MCHITELVTSIFFNYHLLSPLKLFLNEFMRYFFTIQVVTDIHLFFTLILLLDSQSYFFK